MHIDWITVAAQIVNFLVLVWILKRVLYAPVMRAMDARQERVRSALADAEAERARAQEQADGLASERRQLSGEREHLLEAARAEADDMRRSLEAEARAAVADAQAAWRDQLADQQSDFLDEARREAAARFITLARSALGDLADADLETRMAAAFADQITALPESDRADIAAHAAKEGRVVVESASELGEPARDHVRNTLRTIAPDAEVVFREAPRLLAGVRLRAGGCVAQWSLDAYLDRFEDDMRQALERGGEPAQRDAAE